MDEEDLRPGESTEPVVKPAPAELRDRGEFMALLVYRPLDGGDLQRIAGFADTEEYARAEVRESMRAGLDQVQTMAPDSPAVRVFINAASHMHDLRQALSALESADGTNDDIIARQLRVYAVVAYGRTYGSRSRPDLATFIELSEADTERTAQLKAVRNRYAAHSENGMTITNPVLDLQKELDGFITVQQVSGITIDSPMPHSFVAGFAEMLRRVIVQLTTALQPLKDAVRADLTAEQIAAVFECPQPLQFVPVPVTEWEPDTRRPPYPSSRLSEVHMDTGEHAFIPSITR